MGGSQAKPISTQSHQLFIQYSSIPWEQIQQLLKTLKICFPNATIGSYRCGNELSGVEVYASVNKTAVRQKVYHGIALKQEKEREVVEAIKNALKI